VFLLSEITNLFVTLFSFLHNFIFGPLHPSYVHSTIMAEFLRSLTSTVCIKRAKLLHFRMIPAAGK